MPKRTKSIEAEKNQAEHPQEVIRLYRSVTGTDVLVVALIAYESKQERRGAQDDKTGKHKTTERND
jgi:hypothetical protein